MKSERRHELQHNELADWIIKSVEAIKPHQNLLVAVVVIAVVALGSYTWWSRTRSEQAAQRWSELNNGIASGDMDKLTRVAEDSPNTPVGCTAAVILADFRLANGCSRRFVSKAPAEEELSKAIELYESGLKQDSDASLWDRATFGLARAKESKGELDSARGYYEEVFKKWPNGAYAEVAHKRFDDLSRLETKRLYDDFKNFDPKPAFSGSTGTSSSSGSSGPSGSSESSITPTELPGLPPLPGEPAVETKPQTPAPGTKAAENKKSADVKKPAADKKPTPENKSADKKTGK